MNEYLDKADTIPPLDDIIFFITLPNGNPLLNFLYKVSISNDQNY
jgi:hypothetical protein